ncbi:MAG: hypothetical protein V1493_04260 [Candidatus Diapherotrites archaeon]
MARPGRKPTGNRKIARPPSFLWLKEPLRPAVLIGRQKPSPKHRKKTGAQLAVEEREVDRMIGSSYSAGEILNRLPLYDNQLLRHVKNLRAKAPENEKWRYERLLSEGRKVEAYKANLVYDLRKAGLAWVEIEGLMGLDWANSAPYVRLLKEAKGVKPSTLKMLKAKRVDPPDMKDLRFRLDREQEVVKAVFQNAPREKISEALAHAESVLPKLQGYEKNRLIVAINEMRRLLAAKK